MAEQEGKKKRPSRVKGVAPPRSLRSVSPGGEDLAGLLENLGLSDLAERSRGSGGESKDTVITCRIPARDLEAIDALIEAGIRSTRSDAAAWLIHAGIDARREVLEKVSSTVAEIRRLREQARALASSVTPDQEETT